MSRQSKESRNTLSAKDRATNRPAARSRPVAAVERARDIATRIAGIFNGRTIDWGSQRRTFKPVRTNRLSVTPADANGELRGQSPSLHRHVAATAPPASKLSQLQASILPPSMLGLPYRWWKHPAVLYEFIDHCGHPTRLRERRQHRSAVGQASRTRRPYRELTPSRSSKARHPVGPTDAIRWSLPRCGDIRHG